MTSEARRLEQLLDRIGGVVYGGVQVYFPKASFYDEHGAAPVEDQTGDLLKVTYVVMSDDTERDIARWCSSPWGTPWQRGADKGSLNTVFGAPILIHPGMARGEVKFMTEVATL